MKATTSIIFHKPIKILVMRSLRLVVAQRNISNMDETFIHIVIHYKKNHNTQFDGDID